LKLRASTDLALATSHGNVYKAASVCESLLRAALGGLLLLLGLNLLCVRRNSCGFSYPSLVILHFAVAALSLVDGRIGMGKLTLGANHG